MKKFITLVFLNLFLCQSAWADLCKDTNQSKLLECSIKNFQVVDVALNAKYKDLMGKLDSSGKNDLLVTQRSWVKFKEGDCALDQNGGWEAGLDKLSCETKDTKLRLNELDYIDSGVGMFGFFSYLHISSTVDGGREKVIDNLDSSFGKIKAGDWVRYVTKNCEITAKVLNEDHKTCVARLTFYAN